MKFLLFYRINGTGLFGKFLNLFYFSYFRELIVSGIVISILAIRFYLHFLRLGFLGFGNLDEREYKEPNTGNGTLLNLKVSMIFFYIIHETFINPLQSGVVFLYPLKTSENLQVF